jgi:hypothetical protein
MVERGDPPPEGEKQRPQFGDRLPKRRGKQQPAAHMCPDSADLPIFSGTPIPAVEKLEQTIEQVRTNLGRAELHVSGVLCTIYEHTNLMMWWGLSPSASASVPSKQSSRKTSSWRRPTAARRASMPMNRTVLEPAQRSRPQSERGTSASTGDHRYPSYRTPIAYLGDF